MTTKTKKTQVCTRCSKRKKLDAFYKDKSRKSGYDSWCKDCCREHAAAKRKAKVTA